MDKEVKWFQEWFDTTYYHTLYKHRDDKEAQLFIDNLLNLLKIPKNNICLDLACGKGRHAKYLSENGLNVIGLDLSENSIKEAKKFESENLKFDTHDMREVYKENYFDCVFNLFTSFGYFDSNKDNIKVLTSIHQMLKKNGTLVIDFMNAEKVINNLVKQEVKTIDDIDFNISRKFDGEHIFKNIRFNDKNEQFDFTERVQALRKNDFEEMLTATGFKINYTFGDFLLNEFNIEKSSRLIIIASKL